MQRIKESIVASLVLFVALILQTTVLQLIAIGGAIPDISLILLVFIAIRRGKTVGQSAGFVTGLIEDFSTPTPVGFYGIIKTIIGYLYGLFMGRMFMSGMVLPLLLVLSATIIKYILGAFIALLFSASFGVTDFFSMKMLFEILYNVLFAVPLYKLISLFKIFKLNDKETS